MVTASKSLLPVYLAVILWQTACGDDSCLATTSRIRSSVKCFFHEDISKAQYPFHVQFYYPSTTSAAETKLACTWNNTTMLVCPNERPAVHFDFEVTDTLTITGPPMTDKVGGMFRCQAFRAPITVPVHFCTLVYVDETDVTKQEDDDGSAALTLAVLSFVGFLLILITVPILICLLYKYRPRIYKYIRRWEATNWGSEETGESGRPLLSQHPSVGGKSAGSRAGTDLQLLIIGPQGSGKSSLANTITGRDTFPVGRSTDRIAITREPTGAVVTRCGEMIKVVDTPYICDPNRYSEEDQRQQISQWKGMTSPGPSAILLALKGTKMFTSQHYDDYLKLKSLWGDEDFCRRLIVIFTFADKRHGLYPGKSLEKQLEIAMPNLKHVLRDAGHCYMEVNNTASQEENGAVVKEILDGVERKAQDTLATAESISVAVEDTSSHDPQAVTSPDAQTNISEKEPLPKHDPSDKSSQQQPPAQNVGTDGSITPFSLTQPSSQHLRQTGDPETTVTDTSQSGQNTDTAPPPQEHSQEAEAARTSTVPPGSAELTPLVQVAEDGSGDNNEKQVDKTKKKKDKKDKKEEKKKKYLLG